jgi:hypothetical protein
MEPVGLAKHPAENLPADLVADHEREALGDAEDQQADQGGEQGRGDQQGRRPPDQILAAFAAEQRQDETAEAAGRSGRIRDHRQEGQHRADGQQLGDRAEHHQREHHPELTTAPRRERGMERPQDRGQARLRNQAGFSGQTLQGGDSPMAASLERSARERTGKREAARGASASARSD